MSQATSELEERAERRVYHAQFICYLALIPVVMSFAATATAGAFGDRESRALPFTHPWALAIAIAYAGLLLLASWLLGRRQRAGAVLALLLFTLMLISSMSGGGVSVFSLLFSMAGIVLALRAWPVTGVASRVAA